MNISKSLTLVSLTLTLGLAQSFTVASANAGRELHAAPPPQQQSQQTTSALERGYRTGYSDGFQAGYADSTENAARDYSNKEDYRRADRAYAESYGALNDYRDGYRQGFQVGYSAGFEHRRFDSTVPSGLSRTTADEDLSAAGTGGTASVSSSTSTDAATAGGATVGSGANIGTGHSSGAGATSGGTVVIPSDTTMRVELLTNLSSDASQRGDRFQARVLEPGEYAGAVVDGRVTRVKRAGKVRGTSELQLSIEQIRLGDGRWANLSGQVTEVVAGAGGNVGEVDPEGGVRGRDKTKDDVSTIGASTGVGAIIGAIAGGGKGAAIGAAIGGAIGTGRVLTSSGGDIRLSVGQQLRIRTSSETRIQ